MTTNAQLQSLLLPRNSINLHKTFFKVRIDSWKELTVHIMGDISPKCPLNTGKIDVKNIM